jgi:drug/metabolite transporter (DMT)-like permease
MMKNKARSPKTMGILLMLVSSLFVCFGQLFWKLSVSRGTPFLIIGVFLYVIGAFIMLKAYHFGKLSVLQPVLSMNYVLSTMLSIWILGETFNLQMGVGICIIICGVVILGGKETSSITS